MTARRIVPVLVAVALFVLWRIGTFDNAIRQTARLLPCRQSANSRACTCVSRISVRPRTSQAAA